MTLKEKMGRRAADILILMGMLVLLSAICRLWPILLLMILGIFAAALKALCSRTDKIGATSPVPLLPDPKPNPTIKDLEQMAYSVILAKITELVTRDYPEARWIWETPDVMQEFMTGGEVFILLNRAGGYRKAKVLYRNLQVVGIDFHPDKESESSFSEPVGEDGFDGEPVENNYELLAFEWSEAHILELNERCNEAIGQGKKEILIPLEELPSPESWPDICQELERGGLEKAKVTTDGILIIL